MLLVVTEQGPLSRALCREARRRGWEADVAAPGGDDLFMKARNRDALVYVAAPRMLDGILEPAPDVSRVQAALSASNAPGVGVFVAVFPRGGAYADEMVAIRKFGKPYVMVELPLLLEELGDAMDGDGAQSLWLPNTGGIAAARARAAARAVLDAALTDQQGRVQAVEGTLLEAPVLFARAADAVGRQIQVHAVPPAVHRAVRPLARWIQGAEPKALALADRLLPQPKRSTSAVAAPWPPFVFPPGDPLAILPGEWFGSSANEAAQSASRAKSSRIAAA